MRMTIMLEKKNSSGVMVGIRVAVAHFEEICVRLEYNIDMRYDIYTSIY
jgi:hypothetical protein